MRQWGFGLVSEEDDEAASGPDALVREMEEVTGASLMGQASVGLRRRRKEWPVAQMDGKKGKEKWAAT